MEFKVYSISDLTDYLHELISSDPQLGDVWVSGEVSNFHHHSSGHMYFTLKDDHARLDAIMFQGYNRHLRFEVADGLKVNAHGYIGIYKPRGVYQLYVDRLEPVGQGALYLAFEQLKKKLAAEGLFDPEKKKAIPLLPKKIGVVTSPTGAAIRDILSVVQRRFDNVSVLIVPSLVQGEGAAREIVQGINYLNQREDIDLIIVSRGGGSIEDLWPFNEEIVARAIYQSQKPVISGVGHETDFTIADFVADLRAPTPSAAAELAISSRLEIENNLTNLYSRLQNSCQHKLENYREKLEGLANKRIFQKPDQLLAEQMQELDELNKRLEWALDKSLSSWREKFQVLNGKLETLSPLKTLQRGYSITLKQERVVNSVKTVKVGDILKTRVQDGVIISQVKEGEEDA